VAAFPTKYSLQSAATTGKEKIKSNIKSIFYFISLQEKFRVKESFGLLQ
jgi:hypothetical protein